MARISAAIFRISEPISASAIADVRRALVAEPGSTRAEAVWVMGRNLPSALGARHSVLGVNGLGERTARPCHPAARYRVSLKQQVVGQFPATAIAEWATDPCPSVLIRGQQAVSAFIRVDPRPVVGQFEGRRRDGDGNGNGILTGCTGW